MEPVRWPKYSEKLDYEFELGLYIGKAGKDIPVERAHEHIAGYTVFNDLGLRDVSCALVETRVGLSSIPKGQNLTQRTLEHFQFWGIVEELRAARVMPAGYPIGEVTAYRDLNGEYWHAPPGREIVRSYYSQANDRLPQYKTEEVLRAKMDTLRNVEQRFGWSAKSVAQDKDSVHVAITRDGYDETLEADYVVGCDGAKHVARVVVTPAALSIAEDSVAPSHTIATTKVVAKRKLSQNKPAETIEAVIAALRAEGPYANAALAAAVIWRRRRVQTQA